MSGRACSPQGAPNRFVSSCETGPSFPSLSISPSGVVSCPRSASGSVAVVSPVSACSLTCPPTIWRPVNTTPVTAARRYIAETGLEAPALLNVRRNEHTTDRFFWGEKGLFSAQYAEENHFLFPSLRLIVDQVGEDNLFAGLEANGSDDWEEMEEYEYAFV